MKRFLIIVALLLPFSVGAGGPEIAYWVCSQPGYKEEKLAYALSHVFEAEANHYEVKEEIFENRVQEKTEGEFDSLDDSSCRDFSSKSKAEKYKNKMESKAKKKFTILWIDFGGLAK